MNPLTILVGVVLSLGALGAGGAQAATPAPTVGTCTEEISYAQVVKEVRVQHRIKDPETRKWGPWSSTTEWIDWPYAGPRDAGSFAQEGAHSGQWIVEHGGGSKTQYRSDRFRYIPAPDRIEIVEVPCPPPTTTTAPPTTTVPPTTAPPTTVPPTTAPPTTAPPSTEPPAPTTSVAVDIPPTTPETTAPTTVCEAQGELCEPADVTRPPREPSVCEDDYGNPIPPGYPCEPEPVAVPETTAPTPTPAVVTDPPTPKPTTVTLPATGNGLGGVLIGLALLACSGVLMGIARRPAERTASPAADPTNPK